MAASAYSSRSPFMSLLAISMLLHSAMAAPPAAECVDELVMFTPCLAFVSSPPNNLSTTVPSKCCDAISTASNSGGGFCLCYLLRQPRLLGFPLNESRVLSLPSLCSRRNPSLESLCSGSDSEAVPPDSGISNPPDSALSSQTPPPLMGSQPESNNSTPPQSMPLGSKNSGSQLPSPLMGLPPESNNSTPPPSLPADSKNSSTKSSPPPQLTKRPTQPSSPAVNDALFSFLAAGNQVKSSSFWFQTSTLVSPFLVFTCL